MSTDRRHQPPLDDEEENEHLELTSPEPEADERSPELAESVPDEEWFLWSPPCAWVAKALALGIRVARVAHVLLHQSSIKHHGPFAASHRQLAVWGARREDVSMAIKALSRHGLLTVLVSGRGHTRSRYQLKFAPQWEEKFQVQREKWLKKQVAQQKQRTERRRGRNKAADEDFDAPSSSRENGVGDDEG